MNVSNLNGYQSKWLKAEDLNNRTHTVTIENVSLENIRQQDGSTEQKLVLDFVGHNKRLIANKTQFNALRTIFGDETTIWLERQLMLAPAVSQTGKPTIQLLPIQVAESDHIPF